MPQGHKLALSSIDAGQPVTRYNVTIGIAKQNIEAGSWVHERLLEMPSARNFFNLPMATANAPSVQALEGLRFRVIETLMALWAHATSWRSPRQFNVLQVW